MAYDWPGNVRELENVLRQTLLLSPFAVILPENLPGKLRPARSEETASPVAARDGGTTADPPGPGEHGLESEPGRPAAGDRPEDPADQDPAVRPGEE